jgi:hypothetical protein
LILAGSRYARFGMGCYMDWKYYTARIGRIVVYINGNSGWKLWVNDVFITWNSRRDGTKFNNSAISVKPYRTEVTNMALNKPATAKSS